MLLSGALLIYYPDFSYASFFLCQDFLLAEYPAILVFFVVIVQPGVPEFWKVYIVVFAP